MRKEHGGFEAAGLPSDSDKKEKLNIDSALGFIGPTHEKSFEKLSELLNDEDGKRMDALRATHARLRQTELALHSFDKRDKKGKDQETRAELEASAQKDERQFGEARREILEKIKAGELALLSDIFPWVKRDSEYARNLNALLAGRDAARGGKDPQAAMRQTALDNHYFLKRVSGAGRGEDEFVKAMHEAWKKRETERLGADEQRRAEDGKRFEGRKFSIRVMFKNDIHEGDIVLAAEGNSRFPYRAEYVSDFPRELLKPGDQFASDFSNVRNEDLRAELRRVAREIIQKEREKRRTPSPKEKAA